MKHPEGVHVSGEERILVVPLDLQGHAPLTEINLVGDRLDNLITDQAAHLRRVFLPAPAASNDALRSRTGEEVIEAVGDFRLPTAACLNLAPEQTEVIQAVDHVFHFAGE